MKLSKRVVLMLIISTILISISLFSISCYPMMQGSQETTGESEGTVAADGEEPTGMSAIFSNYGTWIWLVILGVAFYFLLIRPQRQKSKKAKDLMSSLQRGDEVVTIGGFYGRIKDIREDSMIITLSGGVDVKINKSAVSKKSGTNVSK